MRAFRHVERDIFIQQKDVDCLGALGKQLQIDLVVGAGRAIEHGTTEQRMKLLQRFHHLQRDHAQLEQSRRLAVGQEQGIVLPHLFLDHLVVRQYVGPVRRVTENLPRRLALGAAIVGAVLRHEARGSGGDFQAQERAIVKCISRHDRDDTPKRKKSWRQVKSCTCSFLSHRLT